MKSISCVYDKNKGKYVEEEIPIDSQAVTCLFERLFGAELWLKVKINNEQLPPNQKTVFYKQMVKFVEFGYDYNNINYTYCCHKEEHLYFFNLNNDRNITIRQVWEILGDLFTLPSVAKFGTRLQLGLSQTYPTTFYIDSNKIKTIKDILSKISKYICACLIS